MTHDRPHVVVSMPAYNVAPFIRDAIESVLRQTDADVELIVVDDASTDGTGDMAASFATQGVRVVSNETRRGIGHCHNRVIALSTAPFIAHVDADDFITSDAIAKLTQAVSRDARVGQSYCDFYPVDAHGNPTQPIEVSRAFFAKHRAPPIDYRRDLIVHGMIAGGLRTYRREVFDRVGRFDETLPWAVDYEMALRVAEYFTFARVPELLYARRVRTGSVTHDLAAREWQYWQMRRRLVRARLRAHHGSLFGRGSLATHALLLLGLGYTLRSAITRSSTDS